jgi:hypothetical protein
MMLGLFRILDFLETTSKCEEIYLHSAQQVNHTWDALLTTVFHPAPALLELFETQGEGIASLGIVVQRLWGSSYNTRWVSSHQDAETRQRVANFVYWRRAPEVRTRAARIAMDLVMRR